MATKKAATKKSATSRATATKKTVAKKPVTTKVVAAKTVKSTEVKGKISLKLPENLANIVIAELVGTFVLSLVALTTASLGVFYIGLAVIVLVLAVGAVSGAHLNPAVTFGLWTMRSLKTVMVPFYWLSQLFGAMLAVAVTNLITGGQFALDFSSFMSLSWPIMLIELVGAAVFMFGFAAVVGKNEVSTGVKAAGVGLALTVGLVASGSIFPQVQTASYEKYQAATEKAAKPEDVAFPRELMVQGPVLNPAVALVVTETDSIKSQVTGASGSSEAVSNRFGVEVILGSLIGAAMGGNLYALMNYRGRKEVK